MGTTRRDTVPCVIVGSGHRALGEAVARELGVAPARSLVERFPDGEMHVELGEPVAGREVYVVQTFAPPAGETLLELLLLGDAAARASARRIVAVIPYLGYARADRRARDGQPLGAKVVAASFDRASFERVVAVDLHQPAIEGFFSIPLDHVDPLPVLARALENVLPKDAVIVSPDLGAAKRADALAQRWKLPVAIVHKQRVSGTDVVVRGVTGDVRGRRPVIVDDMISTGGTLIAAIDALRSHGAIGAPVVAATHALCVSDAMTRLAAAGVLRLVATDSLPALQRPPFEVTIASIAPLLAEAVRRLS